MNLKKILNLRIKKQINKLIENVVKSQILVKKRKNRKKGKYSIPIIIYDTIWGNI